MTESDQFAALNTPEWLDAFRVKVNDVFDAAESHEFTANAYTFAVDGVPCEVTPISPNEAHAKIGKKDNGGWMYDINAPSGWFRPATP